PLLVPPRQAMHLPSTTIGDAEVKNRGQALVSLRHTTLPLAASRHERTPPTPNVQTLPSATAGVLRGPGCPRPAPVTSTAEYLSCHRIFPLPASTQAVTSSSPWRVKT